MAIKYKFDVLEALKNKGMTSYRIRQEKILSESTIQKLRSGELVALTNIDTICRILDCQPGDILKHVPDEE